MARISNEFSASSSSSSFYSFHSALANIERSCAICNFHMEYDFDTVVRFVATCQNLMANSTRHSVFETRMHRKWMLDASRRDQWTHFGLMVFRRPTLSLSFFSAIALASNANHLASFRQRDLWSAWNDLQQCKWRKKNVKQDMRGDSELWLSCDSIASNSENNDHIADYISWITSSRTCGRSTQNEEHKKRQNNQTINVWANRGI